MPVEQQVPNNLVQPTSSISTKKPFSKTIIKWGLISSLIIVLIIGILAGVLLLNSKPKIVPPKEYNLTFWGQSEDPSVVQPIIDSYHALNPNVNISYIKRSPTNYRENLETRLLNNNTSSLPDIVEVDSKWIINEAKHLTSPKDDLTFLKFNSHYYNGVQNDLEQYNSSGDLTIYGVPLEFNGLVLFYNQKSIPDSSKIPQDWPSFKSFANSLTVKSNDTKSYNPNIKFSGVALGASANVVHGEDILQMLIMQNRVQFPSFYQDSDAFNSTSNIASAINFYKSFTSDRDLKTWDDSLGTSIKAFASGNVAMVFGYASDIPLIKSLNPSLSFSVTQPPIVAGQTFFSSNMSALVAPIAHGNDSESWKFMEYYSSDQNLKKIFDTSKNKKIFPSTSLLPTLQNDPIYSPFAKIAPVAQSWRSPNWNKTQEFFAKIITNNINYDSNSVTKMIADFYTLYNYDSTTK